jgi:hypothetical protein
VLQHHDVLQAAAAAAAAALEHKVTAHAAVAALHLFVSEDAMLQHHDVLQWTAAAAAAALKHKMTTAHAAVAELQIFMFEQVTAKAMAMHFLTC